MKKTSSFLLLLFALQSHAQFPEGFETTVPPTGWVTFRGTNGLGTAQDWQVSNIENTGAQSAYVRYENVSGGLAQDWLVTPQFTPTSSTNLLKFWQRQSYVTNYGAVYKVFISTGSQTTHADFTLVDTQLETDFTYYYTEKEIDLSAYVGVPIYVAFVHEQDNGDNWLIDDVDLTAAASCSAPDALSASSIGQTSATVNWNELNDATQWEIEYGATGYPQGEGAAVLSESTSYDITGLAGGTVYDFYARTICAVGDSSAWSGPFTFTTAPVPIIPPYLNDSWGFPHSTFPGQFWSEAAGALITGPTGTTSNWETDFYLNISTIPTNVSAKINLYYFNSTHWLISPDFDLSGGSYELNMDVGVTKWNLTTPGNMGSDDRVDVLISPDFGASWTSLYHWDATNTPSNSGTPMPTIDLASYAGTVRFALLGNDGPVNDPDDYDFFIDNFSITSACPTAPTADAGVDQTVCANNTDVVLSGAVTIASGGQWSGGAGSFSTSDTDLNATYTPTAGEINSGSLTLTLTTTGNGSCIAVSDDMTVMIIASDDPSFSYSASSYCVTDADPTPTITGLGGGGFSAVPSGLSISAATGAIDASASTPGSYTVTYTTTGSCPNSSGVAVTINALDDASFSYSASSYCGTDADPTPTITGLGGGGFSAVPPGLSISAATGAIDASASTPGSYTVTYTTTGPCPNSSSAAVTVNALDDPSFSYSASSYCVTDADPTPTITGDGGGGFSAVPSGLSITEFSQTGTWQVLTNSPLATALEPGYRNYDEIEFCDDNTGFICDIGGKIYRTLDGGDSWTEVADHPGTSYTSLAFVNCSTGYAGNLGRGDWVGSVSDNTLMYKTSDGGDTWSPVTTIPTTHNPRGVHGLQAIDQVNIVGVGRYDDPAIFYKSTDAGITWETKDIGASKGADGLIDLHFFDANKGLITGKKNGESRVWHTSDGGETFTTVLTAYGDAVFSIFFLDDLNGYCNISNYDNLERRYYYTTNGGLSWTKGVYIHNRGSGHWGVYEGMSIGFFDTMTGWCGGSATTYETTDGGVTFTEMSIDPTYDDNIYRFIKTSETTMYAIGTRVYKYTSPQPTDPPALSISASTGAIDASASTPGSYTVTYTTTGSCPNSANFAVTILDAPEIINVATLDPACPLAGDGSITITASGGTGALRYSIDDGVTFQAATAFTGLGAGSYLIVVEDANGCQDSTTVTLNEPSALIVSVLSTDADCSGDCNGTVESSASGGTGPYTYLWDDGRLGAGPHHHNCAGTYTVTVTDANGCTAVKSATVNEPSALSASTSSADATCWGLCDGDVGVSASGGTGPYTYLWDGGLGAEQNHAGTVCAGTYTVTVTDANGCTAVKSATVTDPPAVTISNVAATDATCEGAGDGSITITANGGTGALRYSIDDGVTFEAATAFTGLGAGSYLIVVEDASGCQASTTVTLSDSPAGNVTTGAPIVFTDVVIADTAGLEFQSNSNESYRLEYTIDPGGTSAWVAAGAVLTGDGNLMTFFDPTRASTSKTYRIIQNQ